QLPMALAQHARGFEQVGSRRLAAPIRFQRALEFALEADARKAEKGDLCHGVFLLDRDDDVEWVVAAHARIGAGRCLGRDAVAAALAGCRECRWPSRRRSDASATKARLDPLPIHRYMRM